MIPNNFLRAQVWRDGPGAFTVWLCSTLTGDRKDYLSQHSNKRSAIAAAKRWNREHAK